MSNTFHLPKVKDLGRNFFCIRALDDERLYITNTRFMESDKDNFFNSYEAAKKFLLAGGYIEVIYGENNPSDLNFWIKNEKIIQY